MKKLVSVSYPAWAFNIAMLVLRLGAGALMIPHGYDKLVHFAERKNSFINFLGMGSTLSLTLDIFAEFFCASFIILGLFTRFAAIPLVIAMSVALFKAGNGDFFGKGADAALFLSSYCALLLCGPGDISADRIINK